MKKFTIKYWYDSWDDYLVWVGREHGSWRWESFIVENGGRKGEELSKPGLDSVAFTNVSVEQMSGVELIETET